MARRILVTGSRHWTDRQAIREALASVWHPEAVLVHGAAPGADTLAAACWSHWGGRVEAWPARWRTEGRAAGPLRNRRMVAAGADLCLAFPLPGSTGTRPLAQRFALSSGILERRHASLVGVERLLLPNPAAGGVDVHRLPAGAEQH